MKLCWNGEFGPMEANAEYGSAWLILDAETGRDIEPPMTIYVDDEEGIICHFAQTPDGEILSVNGFPIVSTMRLGPGKIQLLYLASKNSTRPLVKPGSAHEVRR